MYRQRRHDRGCGFPSPAAGRACPTLIERGCRSGSWSDVKGLFMAKLPILMFPSPIIRKKSLPITSINGDLQRFIDDMVEPMYAAPGVGLAAPQVGALKQIIVLDLHDDRKPTRPLTLINPQLVAAGGQYLDEEGCLCIPDLKAEGLGFKR